MVRGIRIKCIRCTNDMVLLAEHDTSLNKMLKQLHTSYEEHRMKIKKTKEITIGTNGTTAYTNSRRDKVEQLFSFKYLGSTVL